MIRLDQRLAALAAYPQFILYKAVSEPNGKLNKIPLNPITLAASSALDSSNWMTAENAIAALAAQLQANPSLALGIGFTLTKDDPFACTDLDKCFTPERQWKPVPGQVVADPIMRKSGVEFSVSATGAHAWFQYQGEAPPHGCKNMEHGLELYTQGRFIALTGNMIEGFGSADYVVVPVEFIAFIEKWFPVKSGASVALPAMNNVPQTRSDAEVIERMLRAPLKAAMAFGAQATPEDLWLCNMAALSAAFPVFDGDPRSDGLTYDASSADMALASHLAFYTGGCAAQVERLMRCSGLARSKWDVRADYLSERTIAKACAELGHALPQPLVMGGLDKFVMTQTSKEMEKKMFDDVYVLGRLAVMGEITIFYAGPNTGKTLLTLKLLTESISEGIISAGDVYYINADDGYKGLTVKKRMAEEFGFNMIAPGHNSFKSADLLPLLRGMAVNGEAQGKILILDTMKKFTDLMGKKTSSDFGNVVREFTGGGGTVVSLAHVNKHKGTDGKSIHAGTSDSKDDCDCTYIIDEVSDDGELKVVEFVNGKNRGDMAQRVSYSYLSKGNGRKMSYMELFNSVKEVDPVESMVLLTLNMDAEAIEVITVCLHLGVNGRTELINAATHRGCTRVNVTMALDNHTGDSWVAGHRWSVESHLHNRMVYSLLEEVV
jgi:hypothetical protein